MPVTIGKKLAGGFGAVLGLMVVSSVVVYGALTKMNREVDEVVDDAMPVMEDCATILNGLNHSVAALRGYILLGDDPKQADFFTKERKRAWDNLEAAFARLSKRLEQSPDAEDRSNLDVVRKEIPILRTAQEDVEKIAQSKENIPASVLNTTKMAPLGDRIVESVQRVLAAEEAIEAAPERRKLLLNLAEFLSTFLQVRAELRAYLLTGDAAHKDSYDLAWQKNERAYEAVNAQVAALMGKQVEAWMEAKQHRASFPPLAAKLFEQRGSEQWNLAIYRSEKVLPNVVAVRTALEKLRERSQRRVDVNRKSLDVTSDTVMNTLGITTFVAVLIGIVVAVVLSRSISAAVRGLLDSVQAVAARDLTRGLVQIRTRDEVGALGEAFNTMVASLRGILGEIRAMTGEAATASAEIATGAQQQLASLSQTAASLNEITTTAEEFKATMQEFADRARAVQEAADETSKRTVDGRGLTQDSAARIERVQTNAQAAGESVLNLTEQMQRIGEITATVNEIAEQTKLLALNASIEAARAGENGRGFAVVATQVRELANQSKQAAAHIESLIGQTQRSMQDVVGKIEEGGRLSLEATDTVRRVAHAFDEIAQAIAQTREAMTQINTGARQQEQGISELVSSIAEIDTAQKESLAAAQQTQKSIVAIDQRIRALNDSAATFKT